MLMNRVETLLVTSPANRAFQRCVEAPMLRRLGGRTAGAHALEIGCGSGYGTKLIIDQFGAATVDALDLDPAMVTRARRRLRRYADQVRVVRGSADDLQAALGAGDAGYDAVFDFGIIHHITNWRDAVAEVARVLRPGGRFFFLEVTAAALARPSYRRLLDHRPRTGSPPGSSSPSSPTTDSILPRPGVPTSAATISPASPRSHDQRRPTNARAGWSPDCVSRPGGWTPLRRPTAASAHTSAHNCASTNR